MATEQDREEVQGQQAANEPPAPKPLTIDVSESDDDGDDDGGQAAAPEKNGNRRRGGYRELREQVKSFQSELAKRDQQIAELRGRMSAPQYAQPAPQAREQPDPDAGEVKSIRDQQNTILRALSTPGLPAEDAQRLREQWESLDERRVDKLVERASKKHGGEQRGGMSESDVAQVMLKRDYPLVFTDDAMKYEAMAEATRLARQERRPVDLSIATQAAKNVYTRHGIGQRPPAPTEAERSRHQATPTRPGANGGRQEWVPTKQQIALAEGFTAHMKGISTEQRLKIWREKVGKPAGLVS